MSTAADDAIMLLSQLENCHQQDRMKTHEINILVEENRELRAELERVSKVILPAVNALEDILAYIGPRAGDAYSSRRAGWEMALDEAKVKVIA